MKNLQGSTWWTMHAAHTRLHVGKFQVNSPRATLFPASPGRSISCTSNLLDTKLRNMDVIIEFIIDATMGCLLTSEVKLGPGFSQAMQ